MRSKSGLPGAFATSRHFGLNIEHLESREMLSAAPLHNSAMPDDVLGTGHVTPLDAIAVINYLNTRGLLASSSSTSSSALPSATPAATSAGQVAASSGSSSTEYLDVNGDGNVTPLDALDVINTLNTSASPQATTFAASLTLQAQDSSGNVITSIAAGQTFELVAYAQDLETNPSGLATAYLDVSYDSTLATAAQPASGQATSTAFSFPGDYNSVESGNSTVAGQLTDVGALQSSTQFPANRNPPENPASPFIVWKIEMTAVAGANGTETFTAEPASNNSSGNFDVDTYNPVASLPTSEIDYVPASITVIGKPTLTVSPGTGSNSASSNSTISFPVTLTSAATSAVTIDYSTQDGTGPTGALAGTDYVGVTSGQLVIPAGSTTGTITITALPAAQVGEPNKTFSLNLSDPDGEVTLASTTVTGTITNTDFPTVSSFAPATATVTANPSGTTPYTFNVTLSQASSVPITINYDTSNGTGTAGVDYTAVSNGSLTIPAGQTTGQITIQVMNDTNASGNPTFNVVLTGGTSVTIASPITATGTILDTQTVTTANASVTASTSAATTMTFTPTLSHAVGQDVIISYTETDGSGTSGAKAGTDYTATTGTVTIPAGSLTPTTPIQIPVALADRVRRDQDLHAESEHHQRPHQCWTVQHHSHRHDQPSRCRAQPVDLAQRGQLASA